MHHDLPDDLILVSQAARLVHKTKPTIRTWVRQGRLRGWWTGERTRMLVSRQEVLALLVPVGQVPPPRTQEEREYQREVERSRRLGVKC